MSDDWERLVGKAATACARCEVEFAADQETLAALLVGESGFLRRDLCAACFELEANDAFSFWRIKRGGTAHPGPKRLDLSYLTELFKRLEGKKEEHPRRLAWIVTLLLLRKKVLVLVDRNADADGIETLVVREKRSEEKTYAIADPRMDEEAIAAMSEDLGRIFNLDQNAKKDPLSNADSTTDAGTNADEAGVIGASESAAASGKKSKKKKATTQAVDASEAPADEAVSEPTVAESTSRRTKRKAAAKEASVATVAEPAPVPLVQSEAKTPRKPKGGKRATP